jgi:hypothetical protein
MTDELHKRERDRSDAVMVLVVATILVPAALSLAVYLASI